MKRNNPLWLGQYTLASLILMVLFFVAGAVLYTVQWSVPVLSLAILGMASLIAGGRYTVIWFRGLSPAVLIDGLGLRESTNRFTPLSATTDEDEQISGFPATTVLNVGGYRVPGISGPNHNLIEGPKRSFEKLNERLAIFYLSAVPVPDRVYEGYSAVAHDISMKNPVSGYVPEYGRIWVGILDSRTKETNQHNQRAFDNVLTDFGTMLAEDRKTVRGGIDRKIEALKAISKAMRKKSAGEKLSRFFEPSDAKTQVAYKEVEEGRPE